jgi:hypothetical protein
MVWFQIHLRTKINSIFKKNLKSILGLQIFFFLKKLKLIFHFLGKLKVEQSKGINLNLPCVNWKKRRFEGGLG